MNIAKLLPRFCNPSHPALSKPWLLWNLRGLYTQTETDRMRVALGDKWDSYQWDTLVCNGPILLLIPRAKLATDKCPFRFPNEEYYWPMLEIDEEKYDSIYSPNCNPVVPIPPRDGSIEFNIKGRFFDADIIEQVRVLPNVEFLGPETSEPTHLFFKFTGGVGAVMPMRHSKKEVV